MSCYESMHTGPPGVIRQESKSRSTDSEGDLRENQYIPLTVSEEAEDDDDDSVKEVDAEDYACEGVEETVEFDHPDKEELQALRGGCTSDSLFDTNTKWEESWEGGSNDKQEN